MDNEKFREEVYKKYDYYKNMKNDEFFNRYQYKVNKKKTMLNKVASFLLITIFMTGMAYATTYYIKNIWKEPQEFIYEEEKKITQEDIEEAITEEEAKQKGIQIIEKLNINIGNLENIYLNKKPIINKIEWVIETDNKLEIRINAKTGELFSFSNNKLLNESDNTNMKEEEIIKIAKEIYNKLEYKNNYEFSYISNIGNGKWQADFCIKYNEIYNPYQCVRITFLPETKQLVMLNLFDYEFDNNSFDITEEQAIKIAKDKFGEENIGEIIAKKDIQKMNAIIYQSEKPAEEGEYRTDNIVRNVWNIEIKEKKYGFKTNYYVDATTGEIIGGNQTK